MRLNKDHRYRNIVYIMSNNLIIVDTFYPCT